MLSLLRSFTLPSSCWSVESILYRKNQNFIAWFSKKLLGITYAKYNWNLLESLHLTKQHRSPLERWTQSSDLRGRIPLSTQKTNQELLLALQRAIFSIKHYVCHLVWDINLHKIRKVVTRGIADFLRATDNLPTQLQHSEYK
jgi:hypothetical protein